MVRVVFLHPDLGIGGAERAIIDAALGLSSHGHQIRMYTAHHDPHHCFEETTDGRLRVTAVGDWLPRSLLGFCYALCAYIRMAYVAFYLVFLSGIDYDVVFCDQISACIPILKFKRRARIIFYCHFPDLLLTERRSILKRLYRTPIDWIEEKTTGMADVIFVNSHFTAGIFKKTFKSLENVNPEVLYPVPDFSSFGLKTDLSLDDVITNNAKTVFLSINRYERKKNLPLAIEAFGALRDAGIPSSHDTCLIIAGGYDERVTENREHYSELTSLVERCGLTDSVIFLRSISAPMKKMLLEQSTCLIYTPDNEHFGIVPVEAMYMKCPVIAVNSGGPKETVVDGETGFLCSSDARSFTEAMSRFLEDPMLAKRFGQNGHDRVVEHFSFNCLAEKLHNVVVASSQ